MSFVGKKAPDFTLKDENGNPFHLQDALKNGPVMLAFYPGDFTPVCTKQLCNYRDNWSQFQKFGVQVVGISADELDAHTKFSKQYSFPFPLLTDPGKSVAKEYGCSSMFMFGAVSRAVVIIGKDGKIVYHYVEPIAVTHRNTEDLVKVLTDLKEQKQL